jgi:hypothetical protein
MTDLKPIGEILPHPESGRNRVPKRSPDDAALSERDELILELIQIGVGLRKAESLVRAFPEARIRKQIEWLPLRAPRRPASLLIAAIERDYDPPVYADGK